MSTNRQSFDLISVIIPAYNAEKVLCRCLESIAQQTYPFLEIIVVNDGSMDSTILVFEEFSQTIQRSGLSIAIYSQKNSGVSCARNLGLRNSTGVYICFIDADDTMSETYIQNLYEKHMETGCDLVISGCSNRDCKSDKVLYTDQPSLHTLKCGNDTLVFWGAPWGKLYKREFLIQNECWFSDGELFEDDPYSLMVHALSGNIVITEDTGYNYYINNSKSVSQKPFPENFPYCAYEYACSNTLKHNGDRNKLNAYLISILFNKLFRGFRKAKAKEIKKNNLISFKTSSGLRSPSTSVIWSRLPT